MKWYCSNVFLKKFIMYPNTVLNQTPQSIIQTKRECHRWRNQEDQHSLIINPELMSTPTSQSLITNVLFFNVSVHVHCDIELFSVHAYSCGLFLAYHVFVLHDVEFYIMFLSISRHVNHYGLLENSYGIVCWWRLNT